ncbi:MAG: hypothetical protein H6554_04055 [Chitinophagales bacterium]|nr:hypothetical protein [Chitinophagales bacterium]
MNFNGDDAIGLAWNGGSGTVFSLIDAVGADGADPGTGWTVSGTANATANNTLIRNADVIAPTTDWTTSSASEWTVAGENVVSDAGTHTFTGSTTVATVTYNFYDADPCDNHSGTNANSQWSYLRPCAYNYWHIQLLGNCHRWKL